MTSVHVERLDHLGLIACMIKDVGRISRIDTRLIPDAPEEITPGEAVAGMILNGLGCANRPLSLTPQFCTHKPLDRLCRPGVRAEMCHRLKLGRTLDEVQAYGCDVLLSEVALAGCAQERIAQRCHHLDTPSFSLRGDDVPESGEQALRITHGSSKDHRPDVQQAV
jgi:transposase